MTDAPRAYQERVDREVEGHLAAGHRPCVVMPTGAGKTFTARMRLRTVERPVAIVHTKTLRDQAGAEVPELAAVFTVQGLLQKGPGGASRRELIKRADMVWVDECHHVAAEDWMGLLPIVADKPTFGSTATPQSANGRALTEFWTHLVVGASYSELIALGCLCPCDIAKPEMNRAAQRRKKVRPDGVQSYLELAQRNDGSWRPGIHSDLTISDCTEAVERYRAAGVRAELVCCDTGDNDRQGIFDRYSAGELDMLASPMALSEGFDSPRAEVLVSCRSVGHLGTYIQWCGRVLRPYGTTQVDKWAARLAARGIVMQPSAQAPKDRALFIDTTDAASMHGAPTADRQYSLDGTGMRMAEPEEIEDQEERAARERAEQVRITYEIVRDRVVEHYMHLEEYAKERGYQAGWVYYRLKEIGLEPPRSIESKYNSVCTQCRRRVRGATQDSPGETVLWAGPKRVYHRDCFFASLSEAQLRPAYERIENGVQSA